MQPDGAAMLASFVEKQPVTIPKLMQEMIQQKRCFVMDGTGNFSSKGNQTHLLVLHGYLASVNNPTLKQVDMYVRAIHKHTMGKHSGALGRCALNMWFKAESKVAKKLYLAWRKRQRDASTTPATKEFDLRRRIMPWKTKKNAKRKPYSDQIHIRRSTAQLRRLTCCTKQIL